MNKVVLTLVALSFILLLTAGVFADVSTTSSGGGQGGTATPISPSSTVNGGDPSGSFNTIFKKTCEYEWDSTPYIGQEVEIKAKVRDSAGEEADDKVEVEVVEEVLGGSGGAHSMSGRELEIQITQPSDNSEVAGTVVIHMSAAGPSKIGKMSIAFEGEETSSFEIIPDSSCVQSSSGGGGHPMSLVEIYLEPEKQVSKNGKATYEVTVRDLHPIAAGLCEKNSEICVTPEQKEYKYELSFHSFQNMEGEFSDNTITLKAGEKKEVELSVQAENKGKNFFSVAVKGKDTAARAKGLLVFGEEDDDDEHPRAYFEGEGFITSFTGKEKLGRLIGLHILKKGETIKGKMKIREGRNYRLEGSFVRDNHAEINLYTNKGEKVGNLTVEFEKYSDFILSIGDLLLDGKKWDLTAISKRHKLFKKFEEDDETIEVEVEDIITIDKGEFEEDRPEVYITPKRIRRARFFGIPKFWGDEKEVEFEITEGDKTVKKTLKPFRETEVKIEDKKYKIGVGSIGETVEEFSVTEVQ